MKQELPACPVEITMSLIGDKWKILIIRDLLTGTKRFGELKKSLTGISQKVLTNNLRDMEKSGLVHREVFAEVPPRVEYSLTETGWSLNPILDSMVQWGNNYRNIQKEQNILQLFSFSISISCNLNSISCSFFYNIFYFIFRILNSN